MKRSHQIQLAALSILGMAACSTQQAALPDPCQPETYNDVACQDAVKNHGYYSHGAFVSGDPQPYLSYYQRYEAFLGQGGVVHAAPAESYSGHGGSAGEGEGVSRGGFGEGAHGAGE